MAETSFAILRVAKLKGRAALAGRAAHHLREHLVPNADQARRHRNVTSWSGTASELAETIDDRTRPLMKRKDAVQAIEILLTASPEWWGEPGSKADRGERAKAFMRRASDWVRTTFGTSNVAAMGIHLDEKTPHLWAMVTPIKGGKLQASAWLDGPAKLTTLQDSWASAVADIGLQRGAVKSRSKHVDTRTYYGALHGSVSCAAKLEREARRRAAAADELRQKAEAEAAAVVAAAEKTAEAVRAQQARAAKREARIIDAAAIVDAGARALAEEERQARVAKAMKDEQERRRGVSAPVRPGSTFRPR